MTLVVYDKAKWHYESEDYPPDFPKEQAFVHIGFMLARLIDRNLISDEYA